MGRKKITQLPPDKALIWQRIKVTHEYTQLATAEQKAEYLWSKHNFTRGEVLFLGIVTKGQWKHMIDAHRFHRTPGIRGRPRLLSPTSELVVSDITQIEYEQGRIVTPQKLRDSVCFLFFS